MHTSSKSTEGSDKILAQVLQELEKQGGAPDLAPYLERYPHLANEIRGLVGVDRKLKQSVHGGASPATSLGQFQIIRKIAGGGMGEIFEAVQLPFQRRVAVKTIRQGKVSASARQRFLREQNVLARLHQTHIVPIHAAGEQDNLQYFAMPFIEGASLDKIIGTVTALSTEKGEGTPTLRELAGRSTAKERSASTRPDVQSTLPTKVVFDDKGRTAASRPHLSLQYFRSVAEMMVDAASAMHHAHQAGVLHRDLKPLNIMVDSTGHCWIIDFGLAKLLASGDEEMDASDSEGEGDLRTASGIMGTPSYMAPEQFAGRADVCTDVWGLGAVLYELLTLHQRGRVDTDSPPPPRELVNNLPRDLEAICLKAIHLEPSRRYRSAQELADDLSRWLRGEAPKARPARLLRSVALWAKRNKGWAVALSSLFTSLVLLASGGYAYQRHRANTAQRESQIEALYRLQSTDRSGGWRDRAGGLVTAAASIRRDDELQSIAAASLSGLDLILHKRFTRYPVADLAFSADGSLLLLGGVKDGDAVWNTQTDQMSVSPVRGVGSVGFSNDSKPHHLLVKDPTTLALWNVAEQAVVREFKLPGELAAEAKTGRSHLVTALSTDASKLAACASLKKPGVSLIVWDAATGKILWQQQYRATALDFSADVSLLAAGTQEGRCDLWTADGKVAATLDTGRSQINALRLWKDEHSVGLPPQDQVPPEEQREQSRVPYRLVVGTAGGVVSVWDVARRQALAFCHGSLHAVYAVDLNADGTLVASGGRVDGVGNGARVWDARTGKLIVANNSQDSMDFVSAVRFSKDGRYLAACSANPTGRENTALVWKLENGRGVATLRGLSNPVHKIRFSADGRWLAALSQNWQIGVWNLQTDQLYALLDVPRGLFADNADLAFDVDGKRLAFSSGARAVLWDLGTRRIIGDWTLPIGLGDQIGFSSSDKLLLARFETEPTGRGPVSDNPSPRVVRIRDLFSETPTKPTVEINDFDRHVYMTAAPADFNCIAVLGLSSKPGAQEASIGVYDAETGNRRWTIPASPGDHVVQIDPAGTLLKHGKALLDLKSGRVVKQLKRALSDPGPYGRYFVGSTGSAHGFDVADGDGRSLVTLGINNPNRGATFSADGRLVAWSNQSGIVKVATIKTVREQLTRHGLGW